MSDIISTLFDTGATQDTVWDELYRDFLKNRILIFNNEVNDDAVEDIIAFVLKWNMDDKDIPIEKRKKIRLIVTSPGGNAFSGNALTDVILQSKTPIMGIALDLVASACYQFFLACDERVGFCSSAFLQHEGDLSIENSRSKFKQTAQYFDSVEQRQKDYILSRTNFTPEQYDEVYDQEFWMDAHKAKELGVIHHIIGEDVDLDYIL